MRLEFACIHYSADTRLSSFACQLESPGIRLWGYYVMNIGWSLVSCVTMASSIVSESEDTFS